MNAYRLSLIIISVAETHIGHRSTQHTCSQQATWNRHTNEQQVVFLAGIITENQRQQSEILGRLILFSTNKTFYPLHSTWPCFFSSNASWLQDEQHFSVISCICGFDWSERIRQGERKKKLLVRRSLPTKKKKILRNSQAKFTLQHLLRAPASTSSLISHCHQVSKCSHYREQHNKPGTKLFDSLCILEGFHVIKTLFSTTRFCPMPYI